MIPALRPHETSSLKLLVTWARLEVELLPTYLLPSRDALAAKAAEQAGKWMGIFEDKMHIRLTDLEREEIEEVFYRLAKEHWSFKSILKSNLPVHRFVEMINEYSHLVGSGLRKPTEADAILDWGYVHFDGVYLVVGPSIIAAYEEAKYRAKSILCSGLKLEDFTVEHLVETILNILDSEGRRDISFDLSNWASAMPLPTYEQIEQLIIKAREQYEPAATAI